jgi:hypothetical protein
MRVRRKGEGRNNKHYIERKRQRMEIKREGKII